MGYSYYEWINWKNPNSIYERRNWKNAENRKRFKKNDWWKGFKKDRDLIDSLQKIRKTTLNSIEHKQRELKQLYNKKIEEENN